MHASTLCVLLALAAPPTPQESPGTPDLAIQHVDLVLPGSGRLEKDQTVVIRGERILSVSAASAAVLAAGTRLIDGRGKFLMPGLADMHVHLTDPRDGLLYVASGVTTIRNLSGQPYHLDLNAAYQSGRWIGPTLKSTGPQVRLPGSATEEEAQQVVRDQQAAGYASIKLYGQTSRANYAAMAAASRQLKMPIVGHIPRNLTLEDIVEVGGHREISHTEEMLYAFFNKRSEAAQELMEECAGLLAEAGVYVTPTISVYADIAPQVTQLEKVLGRPAMRHLPPLAHIMFGPSQNKYRAFDEADLPGIERGTQTILALTGMLAEAGVPLLLGTDAMNPSVIPGVSIVDELERMVEAGLTPAQALAAGTRTPATFWGEQAEFGSVAAGLRADLLLLNANPLDDVANVRSPAGVVLRGRWFPRGELDRLLEQQIAGYATERGPLAQLDKLDPSACLEAIEEMEAAPPEAFYLSLISIYTLLGNKNGTAQIAEQALSMYPESELLSNRMAEAQARSGDLEAALATYHYTLELNPSNPVARRAIAGQER